MRANFARCNTFSDFFHGHFMIKNFVVELIETLSPSEAEELRFFLESPFFNRTYNSASLVQLFDILLAATQDESVEMMEKASILIRPILSPTMPKHNPPNIQPTKKAVLR